MAAKKTSSKKKTTAQRLSDAAEKVAELEQTAAAAVETAQNALRGSAPQPNTWKRIAILLVILFLGIHFGPRGCDRIRNFADNLNPFGWIRNWTPPAPEPIIRKRERRQRGDRKTRPDTDPDEERGIIWNWTKPTAERRDLNAWVKRTVPESAAPDEIRDVADAFYDAADRIADQPEIDQPAEAVAAAREKLLASADRTWTPFLRGLDVRASRAGIASIDDVVTFYYDVADALYAAAESVSAPAPASATPEAVSEPAPAPEPAPQPQTETQPKPSEPGQADGAAESESDPQPPSDPTALPESGPPPAPSSQPKPEQPAPKPAQTPAKTAQNCLDGSCPAGGGGNCPDGRCPNGGNGGYNDNNGYGYGYGWRWF